jgi:hypothetical protein
MNFLSYFDEGRILLIVNIVLFYIVVSVLEEHVACMFRLEEYYSSLNMDIAVSLTTGHISRDYSLFKGKRASEASVRTVVGEGNRQDKSS